MGWRWQDALRLYSRPIDYGLLAIAVVGEMGAREIPPEHQGRCAQPNQGIQREEQHGANQFFCETQPSEEVQCGKTLFAGDYEKRRVTDCAASFRAVPAPDHKAQCLQDPGTIPHIWQFPLLVQCLNLHER
jgi:hypothetical protein